jgi:hypothetical protein
MNFWRAVFCLVIPEPFAGPQSLSVWRFSVGISGTTVMSSRSPVKSVMEIWQRSPSMR